MVENDQLDGLFICIKAVSKEVRTEGISDFQQLGLILKKLIGGYLHEKEFLSIY